MDTLSTVLDGHRARGASLLRCEMAPRGRSACRTRPPSVSSSWSGGWPTSSRSAATRSSCAPATSPSCAACDRTSSPTRPSCRSPSSSRQRVPVALRGAPRGHPRPRHPHVGQAGDQPGDTAFLTASWELASQVTGRLVDALPDCRRASRGRRSRAAEVLAGEVQHDLPGLDVVLDRLVDLVLSVCCGGGSPAPTPRYPVVERRQRPRRRTRARPCPRRPGAPLAPRRLASRSACGEGPCPGGSPSDSGSRRWPTSRTGGWPGPPTCCERVDARSNRLRRGRLCQRVRVQCRVQARARALAAHLPGCCDSPGRPAPVRPEAEGNCYGFPSVL